MALGALLADRQRLIDVQRFLELLTFHLRLANLRHRLSSSSSSSGGGETFSLPARSARQSLDCRLEPSAVVWVRVTMNSVWLLEEVSLHAVCAKLRFLPPRLSHSRVSSRVLTSACISPSTYTPSVGDSRTRILVFLGFRRSCTHSWYICRYETLTAYLGSFNLDWRCASSILLNKS